MPGHLIHTLCRKAHAIPELVYSTERLPHPLKKTNGSFMKISWDEALSFIADKLSNLKKEYGAKAMVVHLTEATATHVKKVASRFCSLYGTPNITSDASICFAALA